MNNDIRQAMARERYNESGQSMVAVALMLVMLLSIAALAIDLGNAYYSYEELQATTQSAALAGADAFVGQYNAVNAAYQYAGRSSSDYNFHPNLNISPYKVNAVANAGCVSPVTYPQYGLPPCTTYGPNNGNAIQVTETTAVPTYFAKIFGVSHVNLSATALATSSGGGGSPWNIAIVLDTTGSMQTSDPSCGGLTKLDCAMNGVQTLMKSLTPCAAGATCSATNSIDTVSLFTFPNLTTSSTSADYCGGGKAASTDYSFPSSTPTTSGYTPGTASYQVTGYLNNFQNTSTGTGTPTLSSSSNLTKAVGGSSSCSGLASVNGNPSVTGHGTYYAGVIYAAQASLMAQQSANPSSQNALILLSDGDAQSGQTDMASTATNTGTYPSYVDECNQAIVAANSARALGTRVYAVAYGVSTTQTGTCATDQSSKSNPTGTNVTGCQTIQTIGGGANSPYYYADANSTKAGCQAQQTNSAQSLNTIFQSIAGQLSTPRLLPQTVAFTAN